MKRTREKGGKRREKERKGKKGEKGKWEVKW